MNALMLAFLLLLPVPGPQRVAHVRMIGGRQCCTLVQEWSCGVVVVRFVWVDA